MFAVLLEDLFVDFQETAHLGRAVVRLLVAAILGGLVGLEREYEHKAAGLRTHMLVALGAALFVLIPLESESKGTHATGPELDRLSRVIQGVVAGVGFLGAGTILKLGEQREIKGLTTAASVWLTAAIGIAVGAGWLWPAIVATGLALLILFVVLTVEKCFKRSPPPP